VGYWVSFYRFESDEVWSRFNIPYCGREEKNGKENAKFVGIYVDMA